MKLERYYYWRKVTYERDPEHYGVKFIQIAMNNELNQSIDLELFTLTDAYENYNKKYTDPNSPKYDKDRSVIKLKEGEILLEVDGGYGQRTAAAVEEYQTAKEIIIDGIVGPQTFNTIMELNYIDFTKIQLDWARNSK